MHVEIWSDIACPWCYIGKRRFEAALAAFEHRDQVVVQWRSFQLDPMLPEHFDGTELDYLSTRKGFRAEQVKSMFTHVSAQAAEVGLQFDFKRLVVANSFRAHQLVHFAAAHGDVAPVVEQLFSGHFEDGRDIGDLDYLVSVASACGLDVDSARDALITQRFADAVRADVNAGHDLGVNGVPFFVFDRAFAVSGAHPVESFTQALVQAWSAADPTGTKV